MGASTSCNGGRGHGSGSSAGTHSGRGGRHITPTTRSHSQVVAPAASPSRLKRRRPSYSSSSSSANNITSSSDAHEQGGSEPSPPKRTRPVTTRTRKAKAKASKMLTWSEDDAEYGNDGEEDVFVPSQSASPDQASVSEYSGSGFPFRRVAHKGKDKMPDISAAQMAVRYPMGRGAGSLGMGMGNDNGDKAEDETGGDGDGEWQPLPFDASPPTPGPSTSTSRGRRNGTQCHLTKKSRGRKVPYVDACAARGASAGAGTSAGSGAGGEDGNSDEVADEEGVVRGAPSRKGRGGQAGASGSGGRLFVYQVPGCGKCYVRGEHLKRHVSTHTNERRE